MKILKNAKQLALYLIVGVCATAVEWIIFNLLESVTNMHYALATSIAFAISTLVNWGVGRLLLFKGDGHIFSELSKIYITAVLGLLMNLLIMWVAIDCISLPNFFSKVLATAIVFFFNFIIRKLFIYKQS